MRLRHPLLATLAIASCVLLGGATPAKPVKSALSLPPSDSLAQQRLNSSPRHGEFVDIAYSDGIKLRTWVVYPERKDKAGVVLMIHEIYGLTDWMRATADQVAADGFIAIAPDLVSGLGPGGGGTDSFPTRDEVVMQIRKLDNAEVRARLDTVRAWARQVPSANGKLATMGFCWGGGRSFEYAAATPPPQASVVFYGTAPDTTTLKQIRAPVLALYGGDDARVDATIGPAKAVLKTPAKYETHVYDGAGHGFVREQEGRDGANRKATEQAWPRVVEFLKAKLK